MYIQTQDNPELASRGSDEIFQQFFRCQVGREQHVAQVVARFERWRPLGPDKVVILQQFTSGMVLIAPPKCSAFTCSQVGPQDLTHINTCLAFQFKFYPFP